MGLFSIIDQQSRAKQNMTSFDIRFDRGVTWLKEIGLSPSDFPRYRDCMLFERGEEIDDDEVAEYRTIIVRTRTGGGNCESYEDEIEELRNHPAFRHEEDSEYDSTYMYFYFEAE